MNAASQVLHLFRFDLLRMRWWLAAYGATLLLSVMAALRIAPTQGEMANLAPYLLVMLGMLVAVIAIQSDSPVRPEAFWRGHAIRTAVLLASKMVLIFLLLIALPLLVTCAVTFLLGLPAGDVVRTMRVAAPQLALWTTLAALSAACTRDAKVAVLLIFGGTVASMILLDSHGWSPIASHLQRVRATWVFVASGVCLACIYLRSLPARSAIAACLVIVAAGVSAIVKDASGRATLPRYEPPTANESLEIGAVDFAGSVRADGAPTVRVRVLGALPSVRYDVSLAQLTAYFASGDSVNVTLKGAVGNENQSDLVPLPTGMQWRLAPYPANSREGTLTFPINWQQEWQGGVRRLPKGEPRIDTVLTAENSAPRNGTRIRDDAVMRVSVRVVLDRYVADELIAAPFSTVTALAAPGQRLLLRESVDSTGRNRLTAEWLAVGNASRYQSIDGDPYLNAPYVFVLQNSKRGEALMLNVRARGGQSNSFVLPAVDRHFYRFDVAGAAAIDRTLDPTWLRESTVRMLRWRRLDGAARLTAERSVP